jgi:hypothetical protein
LDAEADAGDADPIGEVEALFQAMQGARDAAGADESVLFRTRPLMGRWTLAHVGQVCDAYQCRAVGQDAIAFCTTHGIAQPLRFSTTLYGREGAVACCQYWCKKMSFFYRLWLLAGAGDAFPFSEEALGAWVEPDSFRETVENIRGDFAQSRFASLRNLRPNKPA